MNKYSHSHLHSRILKCNIRICIRIRKYQNKIFALTFAFANIENNYWTITSLHVQSASNESMGETKSKLSLSGGVNDSIDVDVH